MKILAFADTHGDDKAIESLTKLAKQEGVDAIICAGDISKYAKNLEEEIKKFDIGIPFLIIPGNHEEDKFDKVIKDLKFVKNLHKKSLVIDDVLFLGCGGGGLSRYFTLFEKAAKDFKKAITEHSGKVVLVTHAPPYKTKLDLMGRFDVGAEPIRRFIEEEQPDYAISGHIHENAGKKDRLGKTILINPGREGMIIEV